MSSLIISGCIIFAGAYALKFVMKSIQKTGPITHKLNSVLTPYYRGGFEAKMTYREATRILAVSPSANKQHIQEVFKKVMMNNHPDKGGSPYLATKINEAYTLLMATKRKPS